MSFPSGQGGQVVHGCRRPVSCDVGLSPATSATPIFSRQHVTEGTLERLPRITPTKVGMTSNHHAPYDRGSPRATMAVRPGGAGATARRPPKRRPRSDRSPQVGCVKLGSLVIADENVAVKTLPGPVHTARHTMRGGSARSPWLNGRERDVEGEINGWGEVVTR